MDLFLNDVCQVSFPGSIVTGALCVRLPCTDPNEKPTLSAKGFTRIRKPGTSKENEEYILFFEDTAVLVPKMDSSNLSPINDDTVPFGHTRYKITAKFDSNKCKKYFSVNQWVGLEKRNDVLVKHAAFSVSLFNFFHSVKIILNLKQTYYLPGETIFLEAIIKNNSWKDIILSKIFLIQTTKYWENLHLLPLKHTRVVAESTRGYIASGSMQVWSQLPLYIPAVIPTTNTSNNAFNYFDVEYKIKILVKLKNSKKKIIFKQKIFIGNWVMCHDNNEDLNETSYEIRFKDCSILETEEIDFIPKYMIYETNLE
ncbi:uncharacterized protein LOC112684286 isoform X2 [Sipha flava]|uniref:Uncharacterized protein LOC112684286 isoform X2 n=1 Tax=Sipha flava TaxID=143950 RepID=A0A8B8FLX5_9HEMI|nr:uncharacterized protein LOC112684286 isoform X2 [Sipha flava]